MSPFDKNIKGKSFLVTGGAGFIGSNLVEHLLYNEAGRVVVLDNLSNGFYKNIEPFFSNLSFHFIEGDIRNLEDCKRACEGVDYISHQAALGSVPRSLADPITTNEVNVSGFLNMLVAASEAKVKRFVYAASSSTYGDSQFLPKVEDVIGKPLSPYAVTKYVNELYAHVFALNYNLPVIGLRYFNVFGPKQDPNGAYAAVIPLFIQAIIEGKNPVINGDGMQTRDFTYIDNAIQANIHALLIDNSAALNQVFNIAVAQTTSINQMIEMLAQISGKDLKPQYREARVGDVRNSLADISKAASMLSYQPFVKFSDGLRKTYEWFESNQAFIGKI
jgi:UDP-N-acetylglucosamine 4-epimerase